MKLRGLCTKHGSVLIFDGVSDPGFRVAFGGASEHYGITPDLATYGKIVGGGMPVGAYGGQLSLMKHIAPDGPVYQAGTLSGNRSRWLRALLKVSICAEPGFYKELERKTAALYAIASMHMRKRRATTTTSIASAPSSGASSRGEHIRNASAIDPGEA